MPVLAAAECLLGRLDSIMRNYNHHFVKAAAVLGKTAQKTPRKKPFLHEPITVVC
jgi:hypothetical protein